MFPKMQKQLTETSDISTSQMTIPHEYDDAEFWPLSGKPYFCVVISKATWFQPAVPRELAEELPTTTVPAKFVYRDKVWDLLYHGDQVTKRFGIESWGKFLTENNLKVGDACVFELMEGNSKSQVVKFRVQILKDDFPSALLQNVEGFCNNNPIDLE